MVLPALSIAGFLCFLATVGADCGYNRADIVFLLDSSSRVGDIYFSNEKCFVAIFARPFDIGPHNVQIGVTTFASIPHTEFNLNTYHDKTTLINTVHSIPQIPGGTRTDLALQFIKANSFTTASGGRDHHVPKILVVMTDGKSDIPVLTNAEAAKLHQMNVEVFAIGVGASVNMTELTRIASTPSDVFLVASFGAVRTIQAKLKKTVCNNTPPTPTSGTWSQWSSFSHCSATCGKSTMMRSRVCHGSLPCSGSSKDTRDCYLSCPVTTAVDGNWGPWTGYSQCTHSCGTGTTSRVRYCNNPAPSGGGHLCVGSSMMTTQCNLRSCSVDGGWGGWGAWSDCSVSCGQGTITRSRACNNPVPSGGGATCSGNGREAHTCSKGACPAICADTHPDPLYCKQPSICRSVKDRQNNCQKTCGVCGSGWV